MKITKGSARLLLSAFFIMSATVGLFSCGSSDDGGDSTPTGEWTNPYDFKGVVRSGAVAFVVNNIPYVGLGLNASGSNETFLNDIYKYESNKWVQIAAFPGIARSSAVAFTVNGKGYVGLGYDGENYLKDFYEYDPVGDSWTQVADFAGTARIGAVAFGIEGNGYVGSGFDGNYLLDFWAFDPVENEWTAKADILGAKRTNAFSFVINNTGYIGGGKNNGVLVQTFYAYNPDNDAWTEKNDLQDDKIDEDANDKGYTISRELASTFVIDGKAYVIGGARTTIDLETWQYSPDTDTWRKMNSFEGTGRVSAVGYAIGNLGYIATGRNSGLYLDDVWSYDPTAIDN